MLMFGCCSLNEGIVKRPGEVICAFISDYPQLMQIRLLDDTTTQGTVMANILSNLNQFWHKFICEADGVLSVN